MNLCVLKLRIFRFSLTNVTTPSLICWLFLRQPLNLPKRRAPASTVLVTWPWRPPSSTTTSASRCWGPMVKSINLTWRTPSLTPMRMVRLLVWLIDTEDGILETTSLWSAGELFYRKLRIHEQRQNIKHGNKNLYTNFKTRYKFLFFKIANPPSISSESWT